MDNSPNSNIKGEVQIMRKVSQIFCLYHQLSMSSITTAPINIKRNKNAKDQ